MTEETDRDRLVRVGNKALTQIATACAALDVRFVAILQNGTEHHVYSSDAADIRPLFDVVIPAVESVPDGATLN